MAFHPHVSAVLTTYMRPESARRALASILDQSYSNMEVIVVEDGSSSGIEEWIAERGAGRIKYLRHDRNRGLAAARNTGLGAAAGEYIAYLDDDDEWKQNRIRKQIDLLSGLSPEDRQALGVVYCRSEQLLPTRTIVDRRRLNSGNLMESIVAHGIVTVSSSCLFPAAVLRRIGGFDERLPSSIDHDIWMALATDGRRVEFVDEPLVLSYPRRHRRTMMTDTKARIEGVRSFKEKWTPVFQEWFGPEEGRAYADRYFARTIAALVALKLVEGNWRDASVAARAVFHVSRQRLYNARILAESTARVSLGLARQRLPLGGRHSVAQTSR